MCFSVHGSTNTNSHLLAPATDSQASSVSSPRNMSKTDLASAIQDAIQQPFYAEGGGADLVLTIAQDHPQLHEVAAETIPGLMTDQVAVLEEETKKVSESEEDFVLTDMEDSGTGEINDEFDLIDEGTFETETAATPAKGSSPSPPTSADRASPKTARSIGNRLYQGLVQLFEKFFYWTNLKPHQDLSAKMNSLSLDNQLPKGSWTVMKTPGYGDCTLLSTALLAKAKPKSDGTRTDITQMSFENYKEMAGKEVLELRKHTQDAHKQVTFGENLGPSDFPGIAQHLKTDIPFITMDAHDNIMGRYLARADGSGEQVLLDEKEFNQAIQNCGGAVLCKSYGMSKGGHARFAQFTPPS
jgi:hypothetical protein